MQACSAGPFEILSRVESNAYVVDLPADWGISSTFNVEDLIKFRGSACIPSNPFERLSVSDPKPKSSTIPNTPLLLDIPACKEKIDCILMSRLCLLEEGATRGTLYVGVADWTSMRHGSREQRSKT